MDGNIYESIDENKIIAVSNINQSTFENGGTQCTAMSFVAIVYGTFFKQPKEWVRTNINDVLTKGNNLYREIIGNNNDTLYLAFDDVVEVLIDQRLFKVKDYILNYDRSYTISALMVILGFYIKVTNIHGVQVIIDGYTYALIKYDKDWYGFDSHARYKENSVLIKLDTPKDMFKFVTRGHNFSFYDIQGILLEEVKMKILEISNDLKDHQKKRYRAYNNKFSRIDGTDWKKTHYVQGSFNLDQFKNGSYQTTAFSFVALVFALHIKHPSMWEKTDIDGIMYMGNRLHELKRKKNKYKSNKHLYFKEVGDSFTIDEHKFTKDKINLNTNYIICHPEKDEKYISPCEMMTNLKKIINLFKRTDYGILIQINGTTNVILKLKDNKCCYIFDPRRIVKKLVF